MICQENFQFLTELSNNNDRDWFDAHKSDFDQYKEEFKRLHKEVEKHMNTHDQIGGSKVYRIYRDVRFSKDKTPYKTYWAGSFKRATHHLRGGYYYQLQPGKSYIAGGFFGPNSQDLLHLRKQISQDPEFLNSVIKNKSFKDTFGELTGEKVKTSPKGFSADDPAIELLRHKQFLVYKYLTDEEVLGSKLVHMINETFQAMRPFFDVMSDYLTTDLNGESLLDA